MSHLPTITFAAAGDAKQFEIILSKITNQSVDCWLTVISNKIKTNV